MQSCNRPSRMGTRGNNFYGQSTHPVVSSRQHAIHSVAQTAIGAPRTAQGLGGVGQTGHPANRALFNYTRDVDPLAANDINMARMFPSAPRAAPKDGNEAIAHKFYNFQSFRNAHNMDTHSAFLRPSFERSGINKLGDRNDPAMWHEIANMHANKWTDSNEFASHYNALHVPHSEHIYDYMYGAAHSMGIRPQARGTGIGPEQAANVVATHLSRA